MHKLPVSDGATHQRCFLRDTQDALLILQSVLNNKLLLTQRRPTDQTRPDLIKSGNVFVVDIAKGPINRWTDGLSWSPSRILGAFLLYREKKQGKRGVKVGHVSKKSKSDISPGSPSRPLQHRKASVSLEMMPPGMMMPPELGYPGFAMDHTHQHSHSHSLHLPNQMPNELQGHLRHQNSDSFPNGQMYASPRSPTNNSQSDEYTLYGSLTSNEQYKVNGLLKKTITIGFRESVYRIVGYYLPKDVEEGRLSTPSQDGFFRGIKVDPELSDSKNIKMPVAMNERDYEQLDPIYGLPLGPGSAMRSYFPMNPGSMNSNFAPSMAYNSNKQLDTPLSDNAFDECNNGRGDAVCNRAPGPYNLISSPNLYEAQPQQLALGGSIPPFGQSYDHPRGSYRESISQQQPMGDIRSIQENQMRGPRFVDSSFPQISAEIANRSWNIGQNQFNTGEHSRNNSSSGVFQDQFEKEFKYSTSSYHTMGPESHFSLDDQLQLGTPKDMAIPVKSGSLMSSLETSPHSEVPASTKPKSEQATQEPYTPVTSARAMNPLNGHIGGSDTFSTSLINQDTREFNPLFHHESPSGNSLLSELSTEFNQDEFKSEGSTVEDQALNSQKQQHQDKKQQQDQQSYLSATSTGLFDERQF